MLTRKGGFTPEGAGLTWLFVISLGPNILKLAKILSIYFNNLYIGDY